MKAVDLRVSKEWPLSLYLAGAGGRESLEEVTIQPERHRTVCVGL